MYAKFLSQVAAAAALFATAIGLTPQVPAQQADPAIGFVATGQGAEYMVMNADGSNRAVVWSAPWVMYGDPSVCLSPDLDGNASNGYQGTLGAVRAFSDPWVRKLYLVDVVVVAGVPQGTNVRILIDPLVDPNAETVADPEWSPDLDPLTPGYQGRIVFAGGLGGWSINVIDMAWNGVTVEPIYGPNSSVVLFQSPGATSPTWSPDGTRIAFWISHTLAVMDAQTGVVTTVIGGFVDYTPVYLQWSRTSSRVAFAWRGPGDATPQLYTIDVDVGFSSLQRVPCSPYGWNRSPTWSPDDSTIVFQGLTKVGPKLKNGIWKVDLATGQTTVLVAPTQKKEFKFPDWRRF